LSGLLRVRGTLSPLLDPPFFRRIDLFVIILRNGSVRWVCPCAPPVFHRLAPSPVDNLIPRHPQISQAKILR